MAKIFAALLLLTLTDFSARAEQDGGYAGIWRDRENGSHFYSIQDDGSRLILIVLPGIEQSGDTLRFSYIGDKTDFVLSRVSPDSPEGDIYNHLKVEFTSPAEGYIYPICDACGVRMVHIQKIF